MARNIRWQVTFKSLNGTTCRIDIYDKDWPAGVVLPVRGAANSFFFEEDDSDDILNSVIRYRTGYIRVIEEVFGALDDIYPASTFDRYVECLYGSTVVFSGYIQVQDFQRPLKPGPRVLDLPVISPLGLFDKRTFTVSDFNPPTSVTLGELLDIAMNLGGYEKVTFPNIANTGFDKEIYSLVVCPYNPDHHYSTPNIYEDSIFRPETYAYLIECICKAYGWICHDTPQALVFTSFDHKGQYAYYERGHIGESGYMQNESISQAEIDITDYFTPADANATMRKLIPDTGIEVNYEGGSIALDLTFERTYFHSVKLQTATDYRELTSFCNLTAATQLQEITGCGALDFQSDNKITPGCAIVAWNGNEGILRSFNDELPSGTELFRIRFYTKYVPDRRYSVKYDVMTSEWDIAELENDTNEDTLLHFSTTITTTRNYVEVQFVYKYGTYVAQKFPDNYLVFFHNIRLEIYDDDEPYTEYRLTPASKGDVIPATGHPSISSSITMPISLYRNNDHMIGDTLLTQKVTEYPYLFQPRMEMQGKFSGAGVPNLYHARMWSYLNRKWRIIAMDFYPWDDEYRLTMQSSPKLDGSTHTITASAANTSLDGYSDRVNDGTSFSHLLSAITGYSIASVAITMGGVDITSTAYNSSTGQIYIASVTGNVVITVVAELPYDAEVEYLQSDGTAYIDLQEQIVSSTDVIEIEFTLKQTGNAARGVFGDRTGASSLNFSAIIGSTDNCVIDINNGSYSSYRVNAGTSGYNKLCAIHMARANKSISLDNVQVAASTKSSQSFTTDGNALLFMTGGITGGAQIALTKFKWIRSNDILFDMIPVRKNGVGYLYDKESGTLYGNSAGSGSFTYGNDKNS